MSGRTLHFDRRLRFDRSLAGDVLYDVGSLVVCRACGLPLYRLIGNIYAGEPMARSAWKYAPVRMTDLQDLLQRADVEPGLRARVKALSVADQRLHCERIPTLAPGSFADCAACQAPFLYAETRGQGDGPSSFADKGYRIQLATIPPAGRARPLVAGRVS